MSDLQSSGRVGVEDLSINSTFSRSVAPFLHVICDHASTDVSKLESAILLRELQTGS